MVITLIADIICTRTMKKIRSCDSRVYLIGVRERAVRDDISLVALVKSFRLLFRFFSMVMVSGFLTFSDTSGIVFSTGIFSVPLARRYLPSKFFQQFSLILYRLSFFLISRFFFFFFFLSRLLALSIFRPLTIV